MSFCSIGRNELKNLMEREHQLKEKIEKTESASGSVCSFQNLVLKKEMEKIHNKLRVLSYMSPDGDEDDLA